MRSRKRGNRTFVRTNGKKELVRKGDFTDETTAGNDSGMDKRKKKKPEERGRGCVRRR